MQTSGLWANDNATNWGKYKKLAAACRRDDNTCFWMKADADDGSFETGELYQTFQRGLLVVDR